MGLGVGLPHRVVLGPPLNLDRLALRAVDVKMGVVVTVGALRRVRKQPTVTIRETVVLRSLLRFSLTRTIKGRDLSNFVVTVIPRHQNGRLIDTGISDIGNLLRSLLMIKQT